MSAVKKVTSQNSVANGPLCLVYCNLNAAAISRIHHGCARVSWGIFFYIFIYIFYACQRKFAIYFKLYNRITEI